MGHRTILLATVALFSTAASASTITGTVFDSTGAKALIGAEVRIPALNRTTVADAGGTFRFVDVPAGTWDVVARTAGTRQPDVEPDPHLPQRGVHPLGKPPQFRARVRGQTSQNRSVG